MKKQIESVLTQCIIKTRDGITDINVFDLMYETGLPYSELKVVLDKLIVDKELEALDIKTYKFIGSINRKFETAPKPDKLADKRAELEQRRREIVRKMQEDMDRDEQQNKAKPVYFADNSNIADDEFEKSCKLFAFIKNLISEGHNKESGEVPEHSSWDNEEGF